MVVELEQIALAVVVDLDILEECQVVLLLLEMHLCQTQMEVP